MEQNQLRETQNSPITDAESVCDSKKRFWEIDFARGICVILMIFDHLMYSFAVVAPFVGTLFGTDMWPGAAEFAVWYWRHPVRDVIRPIIVCAFFIICGVSCTLSRSEINVFAGVRHYDGYVDSRSRIRTRYNDIVRSVAYAGRGNAFVWAYR